MGEADWTRIGDELDRNGCAVVTGLLTRDACDGISACYADDALFRSKVAMARHGFGRGEYKYFSYPLPRIVAELRERFYPPLAKIANRWNDMLAKDEHYPPEHSQFIAQCRAHGQTRPTPLLLRYETGDYNCLHQDLYGELAFPLQATILLSAPGDFAGGSFLLTEQRPRMQSRGEALSLAQGEAVVFAVNQRPVAGKRGIYRVTHRHGVGTVTAGQRFALGIIFHDAQ